VGEITNSRTGRKLSQIRHNKGYRSVALCRDGKVTKLLVHRIVAYAFHGPPPSERHEVCHFDGDRTNNRADNLRWGTSSENHYDAVRHGTNRIHEQARFGVDNHHAVLTPEIVTEIRALKASGRTQRQIAKAFGVSRGCVHHVLRGDTWRHVPIGG
jgi:hypothetical protein